MRLAPLEPEDAELARQWRNERLDALRTPYMLTREDQDRWYFNREGRWWAVKDNSTIGYGGIQHIQWESRLGELSLLINPNLREADDLRGSALGLILTEAFCTMNLKTVYVEVYDCNRDADWWCGRVVRTAVLPARKYYHGRYWDSAYYSFDGERYKAVTDRVTL